MVPLMLRYMYKNKTCGTSVSLHVVVDAKFIGVASIEKASAVGIVDGLQHFQKCVYNAGFGLKNTNISWGGGITPSGPRHFHLGYCFLIWASGLKISAAQLATMHKKLIWDPACSANSGDIDNDSQSDCHSDSDSCAPEVMVPDARVFSSI